MISVIIPTLNEEAEIGATLGALAPAVAAGWVGEAIVADGGSRDDTERVARAFPFVRWVEAPVGRGAQLNAGARLASGEILCFLHADTRADPTGFAEIAAVLDDRDVAGGAFRFRIAGDGARFRLIERGVALRCRYLRFPYGDQGLFVRAADFETMGGFAEIPALEDADFVARLRGRGRLVLLQASASTSARGWQVGVGRTTFRNLRYLALFAFGVPPRRLAARYRRGCPVRPCAAGDFAAPPEGLGASCALSAANDAIPASESARPEATLPPRGSRDEAHQHHEPSERLPDAGRERPRPVSA